jgi:UDP-N-acetylmuramyl pentapeptide phosphotransferase/UDP-N-acetylglucosamine-1-phosphate transferase
MRALKGTTAMRNLMLAGVVLVVLGIAGLIAQNVTFTETKKVVDFGPIQVRSEEQHNLPIPTIGGIAAVIAGLGMIFAARRST